MTSKRGLSGCLATEGPGDASALGSCARVGLLLSKGGVFVATAPHVVVCDPSPYFFHPLDPPRRPSLSRTGLLCPTKFNYAARTTKVRASERRSATTERRFNSTVAVRPSISSNTWTRSLAGMTRNTTACSP